jgi:hypothetical protein
MSVSPPPNNNTNGKTVIAPKRGRPTNEVRQAITEIGSTGLNRWNGIVVEEPLVELQGGRWLKTIREMVDQDPIVGAVQFAIEMLIRQVTWDVAPASDDAQDREISEFVRGCIFDDMSTDWANTLTEILTFLPYGWAYLEVVYKYRLGQNDNASKNSMFSDGKLGLRKMSLRSQDTLLKWEFDDDGGVSGMWQLAPPDYKTVFIPIEKSLLFRTTTRKGSPEGKSILRNAYSAWWYRKNLAKIEAIGIERNLAGLPLAWVPPDIMAKDASPEKKAVYEAIKRIVTNVRNDESAGIVMPLAYDRNGNKMYDLTLISVTGGSQTSEVSQAVDRYDRRIAMSLLGDFIMLGHEKVGSFALSREKTLIFSVALGAWCDSICDVLNRHLIPKLVRMNGWTPAVYPRMVHGKVSPISLQDVADLVSKMARVPGYVLFQQPEVEQYILERAGLPVPTVVDPNTVAAINNANSPGKPGDPAGNPNEVKKNPGTDGGPNAQELAQSVDSLSH